jgi:hypothetical protein
MSLGLLDRFRNHRRRRELASAKRAGRWARHQAIRAQRDFARRNWRAWVALAAVAAVVVGLIRVLDVADGLQWFLTGAWIAGSIGWAWGFIVVASGSALLLMGDSGEQWTKTELDRLPKSSWRTIYQVRFRAHGDIDAIAIGPGGLLVIETKWSGKGWTDPGQRRWIAAAVDQVEDGAHITELQLRSVMGRVIARRLVVLWGPTNAPIEPEELRGVTVIPGRQLRTWLSELPDEELSRDQVHAAWSFIEQHLAKRDARDLEREGPPPRSVEELYWDSIKYLMGAALALGGVFLWTLPTGFAAEMSVIAATVVASWWASRIEVARRLATGALLAQVFMLVVIVFRAALVA